ncbi:MAG: peptide chain release factor N(5)-glutamine methyltransferase [Flavobacteriaceae bacterium]
MSLREIQNLFKKELEEIYPISEINSFFFLITENEFGYSKSKTLLYLDEPLSLEKNIQFYEYLKRLKTQEPIQYILGETQFYGLPFNVTPDTLIPRPETEELVDWIVSEFLHKKTELKLLDIGTGSGCIAISLAKSSPNATVSALDISKEALQVASRNAKANKVKVNFIESDILKVESLPEMYDVIVSNPPYVRNSEKKQMQKNVLDFEPSSALFVEDNNPLVFYSKIAALASKHLNPNGLLFFEINEYLSKELIQLLEKEHFTNIELKKDFYGKDRMLKCILGE